MYRTFVGIQQPFEKMVAIILGNREKNFECGNTGLTAPSEKHPKPNL